MAVAPHAEQSFVFIDHFDAFFVAARLPFFQLNPHTNFVIGPIDSSLGNVFFLSGHDMAHPESLARVVSDTFPDFFPVVAHPDEVFRSDNSLDKVVGNVGIAARIGDSLPVLPFMGGTRRLRMAAVAAPARVTRDVATHASPYGLQWAISLFNQGLP
jgi:hypothetical protein